VPQDVLTSVKAEPGAQKKPVDPATDDICPPFKARHAAFTKSVLTAAGRQFVSDSASEVFTLKRDAIPKA
jgi:hypothetical protein